MNLVLRLCFRELKNSKKFAFLFIFNLALGILGFLILHSFKTNVNDSLKSRSKILLGSDISITGRRDLTKEEKKKVESILNDKSLLRSNIVELYSMGKSLNKDSKSRLIQIKIISNNYPLYGEIELSKNGIINNDKIKIIKDSPKTWISKELSHQLKLKKSDRLKLGDQVFEIADTIQNDTTTSFRGIGLAPKLYIHADYTKALNLIRFGSVASYAYQYKLKDKYLNEDRLKELKDELIKVLPDPAIKVRLPENSSEQVGRILNYLADYLGLVSLVAVFLSCIGAAFLFQNFVFKRLDEIAILKTLGMDSKSIYSLFLISLIILGFLGVSLAITFASFSLPIMESFLTSLLKMNLNLGIGLESIAVAYTIGIFVVLIVCFPILKKLLFRNTNDLFAGERNIQWSFSFKDITLFLPLLLTIEGLSIWQANSIIIGTAFTLCLVLSALIIGFLLPLVLAFIEKKYFRKANSLKFPFSLVYGLSLRTLLRSRVVTTVTFLSVSLGVMLLSLISQLEVSINKELSDSSIEKPSLFLFDIQSEQKDEFIQFSRLNDIPLLNLTPMVRARISKIKGVPYNREENKESFQTREDEARNRFRNRGINLTYAQEVNYSQTIIEGKPFQSPYKGEGIAEVSLEYRYAKRLGLKLGDTVTFEVLGVEFQTIVTSLRKIRWTSFLPNFFITIQPGLLEDAPQTFLAAVKNVDFDKQLKIQDQIVDAFPNVSIINVTELVGKILTIFSTMSIAIKAMAILCILVGFFVIYAIIQNQIRKKEYDILLMKSFGMSSKMILKLFIAEFTILSLSATLIGSFFSLILGNILSRIFFEGIWEVDYLYLIIIVTAMTLLTSLIVFTSTFNIYKKPVRDLLE